MVRKMNEIKEQLELLDKTIKEYNLELPDINISREEVFNKIIENKELFATLLAYVSVMTSGRYITIRFELAKKSIEAKRNRKFHPLNITLDILKYLDFIEYKKIDEEEIIVYISNEYLANDLNKLRLELESQQDKILDNAENIKKELEDIKNDIKQKVSNDDNTATPK